MKVTKKIKELISELASELPQDFRFASGVTKVLGKDILYLEKYKELRERLDVSKIDPEGEYPTSAPLKQRYEINHEKRLKRAYKRNGFAGMERYINEYYEAAEGAVADEEMKLKLTLITKLNTLWQKMKNS